MTSNAQHTTTLTSLPLLARGKVRDNYAVGDDRILMVASDRISAYDVIMSQPIPGKGALLTQMALFWFEQLGHVCPNHLTGDDPLSVVTPGLTKSVIISSASAARRPALRMPAKPDSSCSLIAVDRVTGASAVIVI